MASFPIFLDLGATVPLVVGGGELALSKVRLLLKRADHVTVAADACVPGLKALVEAGSCVQLPPHPAEDDIRGRPLVISATGDDAEDARVSAIARNLGVPVNVPDRPHLCTFSLGAIVDRGTLTVAIGTEGAAPILATRLRGTLEQDLHPRLGRVADIAREFRAAAAQTIPFGAKRRAFWEEVVAGPAADAILAGDEDRGRALIQAALTGHRNAPPQIGRVILVGAGPGDPDLLTLKAVRALKSADVILHDGLMGDSVLEHARREALVISVAKAKGRHSRTQAEINALMVRHARGGKIVVRLKGGDPSVFSRGGEEVETLRAAGIPVEVVPGVTAATAVAATLQIPLTHREHAHSVTFISGHAAHDGVPDFDQVDFSALANRQATLAVYMGLATSALLADRLIAAGWRPTTPLIAVARATQPGERRIAMTLDQLRSHPGGLDLTGPVLLIVGEVASLDVAGAVETLVEALPPVAHEVAYA